MSERIAGSVKFFDEKKGWGFVKRADDSGDVFVHANDLPEGVEMLIEGQRVTFEVRAGKKGARVAELQVAKA